mgnify:CR=1 FL=1
MSILVKNFVNNPRVVIAINNLELSEKEKIKLTETVVLLYHQKLLTLFLEKLVEEDKKLFIEALFGSSQIEAIRFLREKIDDIEKVVEVAIFELEEQILVDFVQIEGNK